MSLIEKAAQRMGAGYQKTPVRHEQLVMGDHDKHEPSLIERSIETPSTSEVASTTFGAAKDVGLSMVGGGSEVIHIDLERLREQGMLTPETGRNKIAEEYRLIKRPLLANAFGHGDNPIVENGNLIMVTSSIPGEGKSFTAINLAISMATEMENTVLLVDADVTKSAITRMLDIQADRGILDVLRNPRLPLSDVLIKTDIAKLTVLPAGQTFSHATELLASSAMRNFVHEISTRYPDRIIIFDTPPLLATSEATVLASYMGQVVFVVEAERTPQEAVTDALSHLANHEHVGLLLNKVPHRSAAGDYYYYGYGYGYGYGEYAKQ
jgi:receptor protein-tyrosine kinase